MKKLTAYNSQNDREISMMMGKAMCAYANWKMATERPEGFFFKNVKPMERKLATAGFMSEYEATVRCIDMFVKESIYEIQNAVIESAKEELGI